jgi:hypothetical protein
MIVNNLPISHRLLYREADCLLNKIERLRPFGLSTPMVSAANISPSAQLAIEQLLTKGCREIRDRVKRFKHWVQTSGADTTGAECQQRFTFLRMRFNNIIDQFDIFHDALCQRSEHDSGVWIAGLDDIAEDALKLPWNLYPIPPVITYLDKGFGAAIRRIRTRLPGGEKNPVTLIRIPRERMIGSAIASSLVHEVGHQGAALLDLVQQVKFRLHPYSTSSQQKQLWTVYERWTSEILADLWSVSRVGIASTMGLISVISLPRFFVFRMDFSDPHPIPWLRVKISCALGNALYPDSQWNSIEQLWETLYPFTLVNKKSISQLINLQKLLPSYIDFLLNLKFQNLDNRTLFETFSLTDIHPDRLRQRFDSWSINNDLLRFASPTIALATIGQANVDEKISPSQESKLIERLLGFWALRSSLQIANQYTALTQNTTYIPVNEREPYEISFTRC